MRLLGRPLIAVGCVLLLAYAILGCVLPCLYHKSVSDTSKRAFEPESCYAAAQGSERVLCLDDNRDALLWRLRVIESAQHEIIFSTFDYTPDDAGLDVLSALLHAAERGVQVRMLVDGINGMLSLKRSPYFKALIAHPNIEVKFYNPICLLKPWAINLRMHDKYLAADHTVYILGGRNTNNLFLGHYGGRVNSDRDLLVYETDAQRGDTSLSQLHRYFDSIWVLPCNRPQHYTRSSQRVTRAQSALQARYHEITDRYRCAFAPVDYRHATLPTNKVTLLFQSQKPVNKEPVLWHMLKALMMKGRNVIIQTPYIICSQPMYGDLHALCEGTDRVEIVTNAVESGVNPWGCVDYLNQKPSIVRTGAHVYEFTGAHARHSKTIQPHYRVIGE